MNTISKKKHKTGKTILITVIVLIFLAAAAAVTCTALALQDPYNDKYSTEDTVIVDSTLIADIAKAAVFGKEYVAGDEEVNSYIRKAINAKEDSKLKDLAIYFHKDKYAEVYGRLNLDINGFNSDFAFSSEADFSINSKQKMLDIKLSNAKLGMLPIPDFALENILDKTLKDKVTLNKTTISLPVSFESEVEGIEIKLNLEEFSPNEKSVTIKSNKVLADTLDSATDKAKEWISEHRDELAEYGDDMEQWLDNNKDKLSEYESQAEEWVDNNSDTINEYADKAEKWINENEDTVSEYTDKAKEWLESHIN